MVHLIFSMTCYAECFSKINSGQFVINVNSNSMSVDTSNDNDSDSEIIEQNNVFEKTHVAATSFKHALLGSLYAQVEFLKTGLEEKNLLIRTLIIKDSEVLYNDYNSSNSGSSSEVAKIN